MATFVLVPGPWHGRFIGEALTNARRHSGAREVRVTVWSSAGRLYAEVSDDGRGSTREARRPPPPPEGWGFGGCARGRAMGGNLTIQSEPAMGTKVRFEMALMKEDSLRTERNHMSSILKQLGVHSQLQALVFALRHGVVEIP